MLRRAVLLVAAVILLMPAGGGLFGQSSDPFVGTWLLSRGKSDFTPYFAFFRRTMILEAANGGYKCTVRTVSDRQQTFMRGSWLKAHRSRLQKILAPREEMTA